MSSTTGDHVGNMRPKVGLQSNKENQKIFWFEDLASSNWLDELTPTILVPGIVVQRIMGSKM